MYLSGHGRLGKGREASVSSTGRRQHPTQSSVPPVPSAKGEIHYDLRSEVRLDKRRRHGIAGPEGTATHRPCVLRGPRIWLRTAFPGRVIPALVPLQPVSVRMHTGRARGKIQALYRRQQRWAVFSGQCPCRVGAPPWMKTHGIGAQRRVGVHPRPLRLRGRSGSFITAAASLARPQTWDARHPAYGLWGTTVVLPGRGGR